MYQKKLLILLLNNILKITGIIVALIVVGCSNYSFVYTDKNKSDILLLTSISVSGDDAEAITRYLVKTKKDSGEKPEYKLVVSSKKQKRNVVIENDQTATTIEIQHTVNYKFTNILNGCTIIKRKIVTELKYNSRAEGFNFGSDLSQKEISNQNIQGNIDNFLQILNAKKDGLKCLNEG